VLHDVVDVLDPDARDRLTAYARGRRSPLVGFWTDDDLSR
jgi:hypothetical protein